jgi:hypothetical protein
MLEMLVQDEPLRARYVMIEARIPTNLRPWPAAANPRCRRRDVALGRR